MILSMKVRKAVKEVNDVAGAGGWRILLDTVLPGRPFRREVTFKKTQCLKKKSV